MSEKNYFKCVARIPGEDAKGRIKYRNIPYLVLAISPTDAEAKMLKHLENMDCEVTNITLTKFMEVIE